MEIIFSPAACTAPLKNEVLERANVLEQKIKIMIQRLSEAKKEHLAALLQEEKKLETLSSELKKIADSDVLRIADLVNELNTLENKVENEVISNILSVEMGELSCSFLDHCFATRSGH